MMMRHPNIKPDLFVEVPDEKVAAHVAAGWLPETPAPDEGTAVVPSPARVARRVTVKEND